MSTFKTGDILLRYKVLQGGLFVPKNGIIKVTNSHVDAYGNELYKVEILKNCGSSRPGATGNMELRSNEFKKIGPKILKRKIWWQALK